MKPNLSHWLGYFERLPDQHAICKEVHLRLKKAEHRKAFNQEIECWHGKLPLDALCKLAAYYVAKFGGIQTNDYDNNSFEEDSPFITPHLNESKEQEINIVHEDELIAMVEAVETMNPPKISDFIDLAVPVENSKPISFERSSNPEKTPTIFMTPVGALVPLSSQNRKPDRTTMPPPPASQRKIPVPFDSSYKQINKKGGE